MMLIDDNANSKLCTFGVLHGAVGPNW